MGMSISSKCIRPSMDQIKKSVGRTWDYWSEEYDSPGPLGLISAREHDLWIEALSELVGPGPQRGAKALEVVDVGSGTGIMSLLLAELGHRVRGYDLSRGMIEFAGQKAAEKGLAVKFHLGDAEQLPLPDHCADVVINRLVFWTLIDPLAALREWQRVVRKGGRIIVIDGLWWRQNNLRDWLKCRYWGLMERWYRFRIRSKARNHRFPFVASNSPFPEHMPGMHFQSMDPVLALFRAAGLDQVRLSGLPQINEEVIRRRKYIRRLLVKDEFYVAQVTVR